MEELATAASVFHGPEIGTSIQESMHSSAYCNDTSHTFSSSAMTNSVHTTTYTSASTTTATTSTTTDHTITHATLVTDTVTTTSTSISGTSNTHEVNRLPRGTGDTVECDDLGDDCVPVDDTIVPATDGHTATTTSTNTTNTIHTPLPTPRRVSYVSHFTHRAEEVGVDHIFLKPSYSAHNKG